MRDESVKGSATVSAESAASTESAVSAESAKPVCRRQRVLVVGAGGFTGGFIVEEGLRRGYEVWAGVRESTSRRYLTDSRIHFVVLDFENPATLAGSLTGSLASGERWDYIIYNLGATKCLRFSDFSRINYDYLRAFTDALHSAGMEPSKMVYMSSLSAMGVGDDRNYTPFSERMVPMPNTRYGASKLKAEMWLETAGIPTIVLRATGIYGPRDRDYFLMMEAIGKGFDFSVGFRRQELTFLYVEDLARAIYDALERSATGKTYIVAHPHAYTQGQFRKIVASEMGKRLVVPVRVPLWGLKLVSAIAEKVGVIKGEPSTLNRDKYNIMKQRNWTVDVSAAERGFGFAPQVDLAEGVRRSVEWYKANGWLK